MSNQRSVRAHYLAMIKDPQIRLAIEEVYRLVGQKQLDTDNLDIKSLAAKLGMAFSDGQLEILNRFLKGVTFGESVKLNSTGNNDYSLYAIKLTNTDAFPTAYLYNDNATVEALKVEQAGDGPVISIVNNGTGNLVSTNVSGCFCDAAGNWTGPSSVTVKQDFRTLPDDELLGKIRQVHVSEWAYKKAPSERHIGPIAEDMKEVFGVSDGKGLAPADVAGISLGGVKALFGKIERLEARIEELEK